MGRIRFDINTMKFVSLFESLTGARVKDCIELENGLLFVVEAGEMGKAIGRNGVNIKRVEEKLKKDVRVVEYSNDIAEFVKGLLFPTIPEEVKMEDNVITIVGKDERTRGIIIGRNRSRLSQIKDIVERYFAVRDIKVA